MSTLAMIRSQLLAVASLSIALTVASCRREVITPLKFEVRTNQGDPVHEAQVKVGGRILGSTDAKGMLEVKPGIVEDSQIAIEIIKTSDSYYFAPHMETLDLSKSSARPIVIKAVMYFVPKPKPVDPAPVPPNVAVASPLPSASAAPAVQVVEQLVPPSPSAAAENSAQATVAKVEISPEFPEKLEPSKLEKMEDAKLAPKNKILVTFHVFSGNTGIPGAKITGVSGSGDQPEKNLCVTNVRGRCAVKLDADSAWTLRVAKQGYVPENQELQLDQTNKLVRIHLQNGQSMEVQAFARGVMTTSPLQGVVVSVDGKPAGTTDKSGRFVFNFKGSPAGKGIDTPRLKVEMAPPRGFLPESTESEFAATGDIHLVRHFVGGLSKAPVAMVEDSRQSSSSTDFALNAAVVKLTETALDRKVFSRKILVRANANQKNPDMRLRRTISRSGDGTQIELVVVDAKGIVLAAAKETLTGDPTKPEMTAKNQIQVDGLVERLMRSLPFQGVVMAADNGQIRALLPGQLAAIVKSGDRFDIFGIQFDARARRQTVGKIGSAKVPGAAMTSAGQAASSDSGAELTLLLENAATGKAVSRGDVVVMRGIAIEIPETTEKNESKSESKPARKIEQKLEAKVTGRGKSGTRMRDGTTSPNEGAASVLVLNKSSDDPRPVPQANVYFNDVWVGTTNPNGVVYLPSQLQGLAGKVSVAKAGWTSTAVDAKPASGQQLEVPMQAEDARLRLDSIPSGASVYLDGKLAGKTPLDTKIDGAGAFLKLEIAGPDGYKKYGTILEVDPGTLELTGPRAVQLEEDLVVKAKKLSDVGKVTEAIALLAKVPAKHTDYLVSRHVAGELALGKLNDPEQAEQYFSSVTSAPEVRDFIDKRFIGAHINEGIAIHLIAEKASRSNPKAAAEGFGKAAAILDRAAKYTRFLPKKDFKQSVQNLEYFRALSFHRRWLLISDQAALESANRAWRDYLDALKPNDDSDKQSNILLANARIYLKQTQAGLSKR